MKKVIEVIYTRREDKTHVAVLSSLRRSVIAMGSFPANCPPGAIAAWVRKLEEREIMAQTLPLPSLAFTQ